MAHFARITDGIIRTPEDIHVVDNAVLLDDSGIEQEALGQQFLAQLWGGNPSDYVQCSYNGNPINGVDRGPYAGIGYAWDGSKFIPPAAPEA